MERVGVRLPGLVFSALAYTLVLELMLVPAVFYWPDFEENVEALRLVAPIPALRDMIDEIERGGAFAYVVGQQFFKAGNTIGTIAAVLFAVGAVAGEAYRGTLEIWLARPRSRTRLLTERYLAGAAAMALPIFLTSATVPWLGERIDEYFELRPLLLCAAHQCCLLLLIYSVTFLFSCLGSNPIKITLAALFVTAFEFALYFVKVATHWSFYRLTDMRDFLEIELTGRLDWSLCGPLLASCAVLFGASLLAFRRRVP